MNPAQRTNRGHKMYETNKWYDKKEQSRCLIRIASASRYFSLFTLRACAVEDCNPRQRVWIDSEPCVAILHRSVRYYPVRPHDTRAGWLGDWLEAEIIVQYSLNKED